MFLSYRDPLFGIIIFFILLFVITILTHFYGIYKEKKARRSYKKLLKRFNLGTLKEDDYIHLYKTYHLPFDSIILLASTFLKKGQYNKAISVYLALLDIVEHKVEKEELLELLGNTYYKGGFLQRSKDIYLKILEYSPRNKNALCSLLIIYENLKDYNAESDVLTSLDQLSTVSFDEKIYIKTLQILSNSLNTSEKITIELLDTLKKSQVIERLVAQYIIKHDKKLFWLNIDKFDLLKLKDLLWDFTTDDINFDIVSTNKFLTEFYTAKGYISNAKSSSIFELDILIKLNSVSKNSANLIFAFVCTKCKKNHPIYESRCPNCHSILSFNCNLKIVKPVSYNKSNYRGYYEKN